MNARGILRTTEAGVTKIFIANITDSPLDVVVSTQAMKASLGLSEIVGDVVMAAPAERLEMAPLVGLALRSDHAGFIGAHRVLLLVQGTCSSELAPFGAEGQSLTAQSYRASSKNVKCLLSDSDVSLNLHGYCDFQGMLQYRLDKDVALVLVSAWDQHEDTKAVTCRIENMAKVSNAQQLRHTLRQEWKTALTRNPQEEQMDSYTSPLRKEYWERPAKKLRRMISEPTSEHAAS